MASKLVGRVGTTKKPFAPFTIIVRNYSSVHSVQYKGNPDLRDIAFFFNIYHDEIKMMSLKSGFPLYVSPCRKSMFTQTLRAFPVTTTTILSQSTPTFHVRYFTSKPTPTSDINPVYSQTDDTLTGTARDTTPFDATSAVADAAGTVDTATAVQAAEAISSFPPVRLLGEFLTYAHHAGGLPWWATIMVATLSVRIIVLPVMAHVMRNNMKLAAIKPKMEEYSIKARSAATPEERQKATADLYAYMSRENVNPLKVLLGVAVQAPVFMLFYFTLKGLTEHNVDGMDVGGALWFTNLTIPDPYYVLSLVTAATFILTIELGADTGQAMAKQATIMKTVFRCMGVVFIPITATFQAGLLVYWSFNSFLSLVQLMVFKLPIVRKLLKLPAVVKPPPKVHIPDVIYDSPATAKARKSVNNTKK